MNDSVGTYKLEIVHGRNINKVVVVDDDERVRTLLVHQLRNMGLDVTDTSDGLWALMALKSETADLVLLDINMPGIDGLELLSRLKPVIPNVPVVMISGLNTVETVKKAMRAGAYDYLVKPWDADELRFVVERALAQRASSLELEGYRRSLEYDIEERTAELREALSQIRGTYQATILALGSALETRDTETQDHAIRVAHFSNLIAGSLGIDGSDALRDIEWGAYLHDIGKIGVPDAILHKPAPLTGQEWGIMRKHPEIGGKMIEGIGFLSGSMPIVIGHHEKFDGSGYPLGLAGTDIPVEARIFTIADSLDAMLSSRPYRDALPIELVRKEIEIASGTQFDPDIVDVVDDVLDESFVAKAPNLTLTDT